MKQLVIDTDIGTDVDDLVALAYAMKSRVKIKAITTVQEKDGIRARIARKLERILGLEIPIISGTQQISRGNIEGGKKISYYCGFEHLALTETELNEPIPSRAYPIYQKEDAIVCIGPFTNIAHQIDVNPNIRNIENVYFMGSHRGSHNFKVDPEATEIVLSQSWKKFFITKSISQKIRFSRQELSDLRGSELGNFVYESAVRWLDYSKKNRAYMYDVLTVSAAIGENFVKFKEKSDGVFSYDVDSSIKDKIVEVIRNGI